MEDKRCDTETTKGYRCTMRATVRHKITGVRYCTRHVNMYIHYERDLELAQELERLKAALSYATPGNV